MKISLAVTFVFLMSEDLFQCYKIVMFLPHLLDYVCFTFNFGGLRQRF